MEGFIPPVSTGSNSVLPSDSEQMIEAKAESKRRDTGRLNHLLSHTPVQWKYQGTETQTCALLILVYPLDHEITLFTRLRKV